MTARRNLSCSVVGLQAERCSALAVWCSAVVDWQAERGSAVVGGHAERGSAVVGSEDERCSSMGARCFARPESWSAETDPCFSKVCNHAVADCDVSLPYVQLNGSSPGHCDGWCALLGLRSGGMSFMPVLTNHVLVIFSSGLDSHS